MADLPENLNRAAPVPVNVPCRTAMRRADIVQQRRDNDAVFRQFAPVPQRIIARFQRMPGQPARISVMPVASHREIVTASEVGYCFGHSLAAGGLETVEEGGLDFLIVHTDFLITRSCAIPDRRVHKCSETGSPGNGASHSARGS